MATLLPTGEQTFFDANGNPLAGGTVTFYVPGTTTPKDTWQDAGQVTLNSNPLELDSAGRAIIYGSGSYRQVVKDSTGNLIWDQLTTDTSSSQISWGGTSGGSANAQTVTASNFTFSSGQQISFIAGYTNTSSLTLNVNGGGPVSVLSDGSSGPTALVGGEVVVGTEVQVTYDSVTGLFHLTTQAAFGPSKLIASLLATINNSAPAGAVMPFAMSTVPAGWLECDGAAISRTIYATLFAAIGTTFGTGDGSTTFNKPDLRGQFVRGWDHGRSVDTGRTFGSSQQDQAQRIQGSMGTLVGTAATPPDSSGALGFTNIGTATDGGTSARNEIRVTFDNANSSGARVGSETRPVNVALMFCIKY